MLTNSKKIVNIMESIAPSYLADSWDNVGFQVGNLNKVVNKILLTLEITDEVVEEVAE